MKNLCESEEVFEAYARIDMNYFLLNKIQERWDKEKYISPIERMIDEACNSTEIECLEIIVLIENIINDKKFIEAPTDGDQKALDKVKGWYELNFKK